METETDDKSNKRNPSLKVDLDLKIIKGLSLAKVPA
jgi:hypothetical protein